jgi:hypothetical protein
MSLRWQSWWLKAAAIEIESTGHASLDDNDKMKRKHKPHKAPKNDTSWSGSHEKMEKKTFL